MRTFDGVPPRPLETATTIGDAGRPAWAGRLRWIVAFAIGLALMVVATSIVVLWASDSLAEPSIMIDDPLVDTVVVVAVDGAVAAPGLYELPSGSRVQHLVDAAGGVLPDADLAAINPALRIADGERIIIPTLTAAPDPSNLGAVATPTGTGIGLNVEPVTPAFGPQPPSGDLIDLNTATQAELDILPGIGPAKAAAIIAYREEHGPYASVDELERVEGISAAMVADLAPLVRIGP